MSAQQQKIVIHGPYSRRRFTFAVVDFGGQLASQQRYSEINGDQFANGYINQKYHKHIEITSDLLATDMPELRGLRWPVIKKVKVWHGSLSVRQPVSQSLYPKGSRV